MVTEIAVKERPIMFSGPMVRAILEGRKTQTRRVVKPQPHLAPDDKGVMCWFLDRSEDGYGKTNSAWEDGEEPFWTYCPYGVPGDRLWVRETVSIYDMRPDCDAQSGPTPPTDLCPVAVTYPADDSTSYLACKPDEWREAYDNDHVIYTPSIFMPRWASRITLEITKVRVERVQDISEEDIWAEGISKRSIESDLRGDGHVRSRKDPEDAEWFDNLVKYHAHDDFMELWDSINAKRGFGWDKNPWVWVLEFRRV